MMTAEQSRKSVRAHNQMHWARIFLAGAIAACLLFASPALLRAQTFFQQLPDLPLMAGLTELTEAGLLFDKPEGRIVEAFAQSSANNGPQAQEVLRFYEQSLPQLGWQAGQEPNTYFREKEKLVLQIEQRPENLLLHLSLSPR